MSFDNLIKSVARRNQMGELEFRDNRYYISVDDRIELACFQANGKFYLHGVIAKLPSRADEQEELLKKLLQKHLGLIQTQRISLCIEPDSDELSLSTTRTALGLNEDIIEEALAEFANNFEYILTLINEDALTMPSAPVMIMP
ncbi:CesT family type III secretion system chaperone [Endozoicomonas lisbonensis]|uniref:YbjN domain-containing protein n=1 Tax=Endozoicomonas lisbonensis TaxID=3120522 RepID=A0ABV2SDM3_9GAMM